jgi:hypothetical protein
MSVYGIQHARSSVRHRHRQSDHAPYSGQQSPQCGRSVYDSVKKLVYGENVSQTLSMYSSGPPISGFRAISGMRPLFATPVITGNCRLTAIHMDQGACAKRTIPDLARAFAVFFWGRAGAIRLSASICLRGTEPGGNAENQFFQEDYWHLRDRSRYGFSNRSWLQYPSGSTRPTLCFSCIP